MSDEEPPVKVELHVLLLICVLWELGVDCLFVPSKDKSDELLEGVVIVSLDERVHL